MAKHIRPKNKYLRRFGLLSDSRKAKIAKNKSEFGRSLEEKQKIKFLYLLTEKQFRRYIRNAKRAKGGYAESVLKQLETRLDNVIFRSGFAATMSHSRQLVSHGHVLVDGKKVTIPSYAARARQEISLKKSILSGHAFQESIRNRKNETVPAWLEKKDGATSVKRIPDADELPRDIDMGLALEAYR